ncbi:MAG: hypothetical protein WCP14_01290 [bacterium]
MGPENNSDSTGNNQTEKFELSKKDNAAELKIEKYFTPLVNILKKEAATTIRLAYVSYADSHPENPEGFSYRGISANDLLALIDKAEISREVVPGDKNSYTIYSFAEHFGLHEDIITDILDRFIG